MAVCSLCAGIMGKRCRAWRLTTSGFPCARGLMGQDESSMLLCRRLATGGGFLFLYARPLSGWQWPALLAIASFSAAHSLQHLVCYIFRYVFPRPAIKARPQAPPGFRARLHADHFHATVRVYCLGHVEQAMGRKPHRAFAVGLLFLDVVTHVSGWSVLRGTAQMVESRPW